MGSGGDGWHGLGVHHLFCHIQQRASQVPLGKNPRYNEPDEGLLEGRQDSVCRWISRGVAHRELIPHLEDFCLPEIINTLEIRNALDSRELFLGQQ